MAEAAEKAENSGAGDSAGSIHGSSSAAILLMAMGEDNAANVLKYMEPTDVQAIGEAMNAIGSISQDQIGSTLDNFIQKIEKESSIGVAPGSYLQDMLERALGKERALSVMAQIDKDSIAPALDSLKWMPDSIVAKLISDEHPQFIAIVMSYLSREKAAAILEGLSEERKADVVVRVSRLETVQPKALKEIDAIIEKRFGQSFETELAGAGGIKAIAEILNCVSTDQENLIMENLTALDAELATDIREKMFVFENLLTIDDRGIQSLLREVSGEILVKALKGADQEIRNKLFKNMSSRAASLLQDDLEASAPMKLADVEEAQKEILTIAQTLAEEGKISLGTKGGDFV
ncbi:MAG: flagellar motor switch protein FliG [Granulosicoccus sp.]|nr:flagellar motor switch protein FliG [Granulosicoccus sp.]